MGFCILPRQLFDRFQLIWMGFCILLRLVRVMNLILIFISSSHFSRVSRLVIFQGIEPYLCDFVRGKEPSNIGLYSDIYRPVSFKLAIMIGTTKFFMLISVWIKLTFIQGHSCMRNQTLWCPFSQKFRRPFGWNSVCCHTNLLKRMLNLICTIDIQRRELCWCGLIKYIIDIVLCRDSCKPICFKVGRILDTTEN